MQYPARYAELPEYAFPRLRRLLAPHAPGGPEIAMSLGEPQHQVPGFVGEIMLEHTAKLSKYPPNEGLPELREAISDWLARRYSVAEGYRDPEAQVFPLNGTREGLYHACVALSPELKNGAQPAVLLPNPFYQCYTVAAVTAGAEPVYLPCGPETGFLPDFASLPKDLLDRTTVAYLCSPANPQGVCADRNYWKTLLNLAEAHDFKVFADECYSEIYRNEPPVGALQVASEIGADPERLVAFHSLSKRSNLAGLRSGFAVTGPENRKRMLQMRSYVGAPLPIPAQHAAAACWRDEAHVVDNRALYQQKYAIADEILGNLPGYSAPDAGFFLWLDVGDGEAASIKLWQSSGVKALPGSYLSRSVDPALGGGDPGTRYLRLAMVAPPDDVRRGLEHVRTVLMET
ncbi:MAG: aminotransferase class I/II-fold pyridoxal phosphate-dependent enzyme [Paracoccaceae bacterium]